MRGKSDRIRLPIQSLPYPHANLWTGTLPSETEGFDQLRLLVWRRCLFRRNDSRFVVVSRVVFLSLWTRTFIVDELALGAGFSVMVRSGLTGIPAYFLRDSVLFCGFFLILLLTQNISKILKFAQIGKSFEAYDGFWGYRYEQYLSNLLPILRRFAFLCIYFLSNQTCFLFFSWLTLSNKSEMIKLGHDFHR